jgi:PIN domain nuclease of toxin-antitoxin system
MRARPNRFPCISRPTRRQRSYLPRRRVSYLLDTNVLLWLLAGSDRVSQPTRDLLADPHLEVLVSAASAWEIAIKASQRRVAVPPNIAVWLPDQLTANRLTPLPVTIAHAAGVEHLPPHHTDPFDRILIAQALAEDIPIVTGDRQLERYGVQVIRC